MEFTNPTSHTHDPPTSREAEEKITESGTRERHSAIVLELVRRFPGRTAIELQHQQSGLNWLDEYQIRRRLVDLKAANLVKQGEARACRIRGTKMVTWTVVEQA